MKERRIRMFFPVLLRKDQKPRKWQNPVVVSLNGQRVVIQRGVVVEAPSWVQEVCDSAGRDDFECFVSSRKVPV